MDSGYRNFPMNDSATAATTTAGEERKLIFPGDDLVVGGPDPLEQRSDNGRTKDAMCNEHKEPEQSGAAHLQVYSGVVRRGDRQISSDSGIIKTPQSSSEEPNPSSFENETHHNEQSHHLSNSLPGSTQFHNQEYSLAGLRTQNQRNFSSNVVNVVNQQRDGEDHRDLIKQQLCDELSKENASLRSRLKGVNVLSTCLAEARIELSQMNTQKNKMEIAVENLQSRLHKLGANTSVDLQQHEIFLPGHDKEFVNSLISENMRLQQAIKSGANNPTAKMVEDQLTKKIHKLETIILELTEKCREKQKTLEHLQRLVKSSDQDKDKEIVGLQEKLTRQNQARENAESICESLTDQTETLREHVQTVIKDREEAVAKLEEQKKQDKSDDVEIKIRHVGPNLKPEEQVRILEQQIDQMERENVRLTEQLKEVIGMNTRWQRYNDQREAYVIKQSKTTYQQQSKITVLEQRCSDLNKEIADLKKDNNALQTLEDHRRDAALIAADQQIAFKEEKIEELEGRVKELSEMVQSKYGGHQAEEVGDKEQIQMLQNQVKTFATDFEAERNDRQASAMLYEEAVGELKQRDNIIQALQEQLQRQSQASRSPGHAGQRFSPPSTAPQFGQYSCGQQMLSRSGGVPQRFYGEDMTDLPRDVQPDTGALHFDEPDGGPQVLRPHHRVGDDLCRCAADDICRCGVVAGGAEDDDEDDEPLQCPHCYRSFKVVDHDKFMKHAMNCLEDS